MVIDVDQNNSIISDYFNSFVIARYDFVKYMQKISDIEQFHENGKLNIEILQKIIF